MTFYLKRPAGEDPAHREKMDELKDRVRRFRHDPALISENRVGPGLGLRDAYSYLVPMIDTDVYMRWLLDEGGCPFRS